MSRYLRTWAAVGVTAALAACGGGGGSETNAAASDVSTKQVDAGTVTGFGSVIVEGRRYDDSAAIVSIEQDASAPRAAARTDVKLGMQVLVTSDDGSQAATLVVRSEVVGPIGSLSADGFVVAGQRVRISTDPAAPTVFEGAAGLADLQAGDRVEVHGQRDADGVIVATRIERCDPSASAFVRVAGTVSGLDASGHSFLVGGLQVTWSDATRLLPMGVTLANGQRVAIWSDAAIVGNALAAKAIVVRASGLSDDGLARVGGLLRGLDVAARTFTLGDVKVDATKATFVNGTAADLANGRHVRVTGTVTGGVLAATEVSFVRQPGDAIVDLTGPVTDFVSSASFRVRGVAVDASGTTVAFLNGVAQSLGNGVLVRVQGTVSGNVVTATSVSFASATLPRPGPLTVIDSVEGVAYQVDVLARRFRLNGVDVVIGVATVIDGNPADLRNGARLVVAGTIVDGVLIAGRVKVLSATQTSAST